MFKLIKIAYDRPYRLLQVLQNLFIDLKFGGRYLGIPLNNMDDSAGYTNTTSTEYSVLDKIFSEVRLNSDDIIVDVGCGKGRVFNWFLNKKFKNNLIGIEVYAEVADFVRRRLSAYPQVNVITGNVNEVIIPNNATVFYLFHPFREPLMRIFAANLLARIEEGQFQWQQRPLIIYHNCCYLNVFEESSAWKVKKLGVIGLHETALIWVNDK